MPGSVLVDSSFFIERLRAGDDPFEEFAACGPEWDFATCGIVVAEVLRGVKHKTAHARMKLLFGSMIYVPTQNRIWERVAQLAWQLDRQGLSMQLTDLTIAVCALAAESAVLTLDSDFQKVPNLRVLRRLD